MTINKKKELGQIFTPKHIVNMILNEVGYVGESVLNKKIIEPAFGDGAFLIEIVKRLINYCTFLNMSKSEIISQLENNIFGIEIDSLLYLETKSKLNLLLNKYGIYDEVKWNLFNQNALIYREYNSFDYVVGNPPYIRMHNLNEQTEEFIKDFKFSKGTIDMYVLFFELSINLLDEKGILGIITPNSFMKNTSQCIFRKYLIEENLIYKIIDFKSSAVFKNVNTYNAISIIRRDKTDFNLIYTQYDENTNLYRTNINLLDYIVETQGSIEPWNFSNEKNNELLLSVKNKPFKLSKYCKVQYGITTNKNCVYIGEPIAIKGKEDTVIFNGAEIESGILKKAVKGSTYNGGEIVSAIIFPYRWDLEKNRYVPIEEYIFKQKYPLAYNYLLMHKEELENRDMDNSATTWYQYGRSQGLINSRYKKLTFKHILNETNAKIEVFELPEDVIVYSGIYITAEDDIYFSEIKSILSTEEFFKYCILVGREMNGGYKNITSKHVKNFGMH